MKKILVLLLLFFSFLAGFSQTGNDTTKYTWYKYVYGNRAQRYWADSVLNIPRDTTFSKWGLARKGTVLYVGNGTLWTAAGGANTGSNGIELAGSDFRLGSTTLSSGSPITADRYININPTKTLGIYTTDATNTFFETIKNTEWAGDIDNGAGLGSIQWDATPTQYYLLNTDAVGERQITVSPTVGIQLGEITSGVFKGLTVIPFGNGRIKLEGYTSLSSSSDTTNNKPLAVNTSTGVVTRMDGWAGSGGGGGTATLQTITSGSSGTVTGSNYWVRFNPASALATYTLTLPASPTVGQSVTVIFGGTITAGIVVTAFTVAPNTSQSIIDNTPPAGSSVTADNAFQYLYVATNLWIRKKL